MYPRHLHNFQHGMISNSVLVWISTYDKGITELYSNHYQVGPSTYGLMASDESICRTQSKEERKIKSEKKSIGWISSSPQRQQTRRDQCSLVHQVSYVPVHGQGSIAITSFSIEHDLQFDDKTMKPFWQMRRQWTLFNLIPWRAFGI